MKDYSPGGPTGKRARELFLSGLNCAESLLIAGMELQGIEGDWFPRIASGLGAGICRTGMVCGSVSGAVLVLGMATGRDDASVKPYELYGAGNELVGDFTDRFGSTSCGKLLGVDLSDPDELEAARESGLFMERCPSFVGFCGDWIERRLGEAAKE